MYVSASRAACFESVDQRGQNLADEARFKVLPTLASCERNGGGALFFL